MLTKLKAYSSVAAVALPLDDAGSEERDLIQIRGITGLNPVKSTINTSTFANIDGAAYTGKSVPPRNIVLTVRPNPDYVTWDVEGLRRLIYLYFRPTSAVQLVFENDVRDPVTIFGYVESCEVNPFVKDVEFQISILCPDPYFTSLNPTVVTGVTSNSYSPQTITYHGDLQTGVNVEVDFTTGQPITSSVQIQTVDPAQGIFSVDARVDVNQFFVMSSVAGNKYVDAVRTPAGTVVSLLSKVSSNSSWPALSPGDNPFSVITDVGNHAWTLTYYERFGGL